MSVLNDVGEDILLAPILKTTKKFYFVVLFLLSIIAWGGYAFYLQSTQGLGVTGMNRPVLWAIYMVNFVFFIGISHAGTLISAILRVSQAEWRRPVTRVAEAITVFALCVGGPQVLIDLGRPDRLINPFIEGRFQSPIIWDVCCITTYLVGSITYLYLPLIPDLAVVRDRMPDKNVIRKFFYRVLAMGWEGTEKQIHALERAIGFMAVVIIPIAISVHTVVAFIFSMTVQPMWHSTILGPYFVIGAIFTGIASLMIVMAILRKVYHLERYFTKELFDNLSTLLVVFVALWAYATVAEYLTTFYGSEPAHMSVFYAKFSGEFAVVFWIMIVACLVIPFPLLAVPRLRSITGYVVASVSINIGMWLERYTIVIPTLTNPRLPADSVSYMPTWVEVAITCASFATLAVLLCAFLKLFPIVSLWEVREGEEIKEQERDRIISEYLAGEQQQEAEHSLVHSEEEATP